MVEEENKVPEVIQPAEKIENVANRTDKMQELERIKKKSKISKQIGNIKNFQNLRSQSVGGIGAISQEEINEIRNQFLIIQNKGPDGEETDPMEAAKQMLNKEIFSLDESGNVVNFLLSPPKNRPSKDQYVESIMNMQTNKIMTIQVK